jgi:hypothetical protein
MKKISIPKNIIAGLIILTISISNSFSDPRRINNENEQRVSVNPNPQEEEFNPSNSTIQEYYLKSTQSDPCIPNVPYTIPFVPKNNYTNHIYIDPSRSSNGNGTIGNPYNTFNGLTIQANTSYYLKRGTKLNERVRKLFVKNYITSYGDGALPIVEQGIILMNGSRDLVIDGLDIRKTTSRNHSIDNIIYSEGNSILNIYITNNIIQGVYSKTPSGVDNMKAPIHYPVRGIRFGNTKNFTIYNNIIRNVHDDGIWIASSPDLKIVRNWIYDINKGGYDEAKKVWHNVGGDCIQLEYGYKNLYMAGNILDKSNTTWKFSFIINSAWDNTNRNIVIEYNTFVGSRSGNGGAVVYLNAPAQTIFRYNVVDATNKGMHSGGVVPLSSSHSRIKMHLEQSPPYGILNNHLIKKSSNFTYPNFDKHINKSNILHQNYSDYTKYLLNNPGKKWGSDIDTKDFWKHVNCAEGYLIEFSVKNASGVNITNATITFAGRKNPQGNYQFPKTKTGTYSYSITANGYQTLSVSNLQISKNTLVPVRMVASPLKNALNLDDNNHNDVNENVDIHFSQEPERIYISAISDPPGFTFITGAGEYHLLDPVNLEAPAVDEDYEFVGWLENGTLLSKDRSYRFTASENREFTAKFEYAPQLFNVEVVMEDSHSGNAMGSGQYKKGDMAVAHFQTNIEYIFKGWANSSGLIVSGQNPYNFEVLMNTTLSAVVEKNKINSESPISVYPNPGNGIIYIQNRYNDSVNLKVMNSQGIVVESRTILSDFETIDLRGLPPGLFLLHFEYKDEVTIKKIIFN